MATKPNLSEYPLHYQEGWHDGYEAGASMQMEPDPGPEAPGYRIGLTYGDGYRRGFEDGRKEKV